MSPRLVILLAASAVGVLFAVGLFTHGVAGGILLLITDALLVTLSRGSWAAVRPQGRPVRIIVIVLVAVIAVIKLAGEA